MVDLKNNKPNGKFLRTVLRADIFERLTEFAQSYSNGLNNWDYGVAIQILLDFFESHNNIVQINDKLDYVINAIQPSEDEGIDETPKKESGTDMLGGEVLK